MPFGETYAGFSAFLCDIPLWSVTYIPRFVDILLDFEEL